MCIVAINILETRAFNPESQHFISLLIKFHDFGDKSQEGMKHQMRGATHAQQGMTLGITQTYGKIPLDNVSFCRCFTMKKKRD
jgi:hypothetical protein